MIALTVAQVCEATSGIAHHLAPTDLITDVRIDSRDISAGCLFVAIKGERADGHDFAASVIADGAIAVLAAYELEQPCIVVDDPVLALGRLAHWVRTRLLTCTVIGVTGSSGKTSTKELIGGVLSADGPTVCPEGSFNTEVGVPLTILKADETTKYLVLEMGMRGEGQIRYLAEIALPSVGVLVNVGTAHAELLGSREAIARAKGELIDSLPPDGFAIINGDDPLILAKGAETPARVIAFGRSAACDVRATDVRLDAAARPSFTLHHANESVAVTLKVHGEHFVQNALAAASVALALGIHIDVVAAELRVAGLDSKWRMEVHELGNHVTLVNDCYNANPESMRAALAATASMAAGRRSWAILGEMRELGESSREEHESLGRAAAAMGIDRLVCIGDALAPTHEAAAAAGLTSFAVTDIQDAVSIVTEQAIPGDVILVKASRGIALERVADALSAWNGGAA
ncbi:MAG: UDP-N-acetylmuramoyl-tripeptide--D-alanyl-D-alanine ligase [Actinomycetota bacterium]